MSTKLLFCLRIIVITFLPLPAFFSCDDNRQNTDYNVLVDSLKQSEGGVYLDQPELNRFLYAERNDTTIDENWFMGVLHVIDTKQNTEQTIRVNGNDHPKYLLRGESDSIVCLISIGGSAGFCCFSRINLNEMRETLYKSLNSNFFTLDSISDKGYHGKVFYRWQGLDRNPGEDSISSVVIDYMGDEYPVSIDGGEECVRVNVDSCLGVKFIVYHPKYSCIRLACGDIPNGNDEKQIFCAAAAFTGVGYENGFDHMLIAGNHASDGVYYKGYTFLFHKLAPQ